MRECERGASEHMLPKVFLVDVCVHMEMSVCSYVGVSERLCVRMWMSEGVCVRPSPSCTTSYILPGHATL